MADSSMGLQGKRILVVDDDFSLRVLLEAILKRLGAITLLASDGAEAIAQLREQPDLVVLDLMMPKADGYAVIEHLRAYAPTLLDRTIVITAAPAKRRQPVHGLPVFEKPFDLDVVVAALEARLEGRLHTPPSETAEVVKRRTGFATKSPQERRELARRGGRAAHEKGVAHTFTSTTAQIAGRRGGEAVSRDRAHMARIARKGRPAKPPKEKPMQTMREPDAPSDDVHTRLHNVRGAIGGLQNYLGILAIELPKALRATIQATAQNAARADTVARALADDNVSAVPELADLLAWLNAARDSAETAHHIINPRAPTSVDIHDTIRRAATLIAPRFAERGGTLHHDLRATPGSVTVDQGDLIAVWTNLLENALTAGARNASMQTGDDQKGMRIIVRDDGPGIPPAVLPKLFKGASTKPDGGTGLKYVHSVITGLSGTITVTSAPGYTIFTMILPTIATPPQS
jgi:uncharacterized protein